MRYSYRTLVWTLAALCFVGVAMALGLQEFYQLEPCPMCITQRYLWLLLGVCFALSGYRRGMIATACVTLVGIGGLITAGRQSWLQWYPPEFPSCGRDLYGMIADLPLQKWLPLLFRGSGDCSTIDWTFLGLSIANWSFLGFLGFLTMGLFVYWRSLRASGVVCLAANA